MVYRKQLGLKDFSPKSQDAVALQQIKERGALPMIDRGDIRQAIDRCSNIWASLPRHGQFEHKADSLIAKFKEAGGTAQTMSEATAIYLHVGDFHQRLSKSAWLIITRRTPPSASQRDKNAGRTGSGERGTALTCRCVSVMLLRSMQNTRRS